MDTLYNAREAGRSVKFPRVSPDGKRLLYTVSDYGNFSIWHKDADLHMLDLSTGAIDSLPEVNSPDVESYHSWSGNSRWFVFSSRRGDGFSHVRIWCMWMSGGSAASPSCYRKRLRIIMSVPCSLLMSRNLYGLRF